MGETFYKSSAVPWWHLLLGSYYPIVSVTPLVSIGPFASHPDHAFREQSKSNDETALAAIHARYRTPHIAIAFTAVLAVINVAFRTFDQLAEAFVLGTWPFLALAVSGVFILRRTRPDLPRPYRMMGYPFVPIVFLVASLALTANALMQRPTSTAIGFGITLLGVPVRACWVKCHKVPAVADVETSYRRVM